MESLEGGGTTTHNVKVWIDSKAPVTEQIKLLEEQANQLEQQQDIAPVQAQVNEQVQTEDIAPFKMANVEETQQPTTQEVESNLATEVESNTQNNPNTQLSDALINEIQYKTAKANENNKNVKMVSPNEIVTDGGNGGYRTQEQVSKLTEEIKRNGIVTPIEVKVENGKVEVVNGNHRLSIAKELGIKEVPVVYVTDNMENIDNSQDILYNNENKGSLDYVEGEFERGNRNGSDVDEGNVRSESNEKDSANNNVTSENEGTTGEHDKVSKKVQRDNDGPSSASTSKQNTTPTQAELDNLEYTRKNKSGSEYASAFYDLGKKYGTTNLYKALNNYKSTGQAISEDIENNTGIKIITSEEEYNAIDWEGYEASGYTMQGPEVVYFNSETGEMEEATAQLTSLDLSKATNLETIGVYAFGSNQTLETVKLPSDGVLTTIGGSAFYENEIASLTFEDAKEKPSQLTLIGGGAMGAGAFASNQITEVIIPSSVTTIELFAFSNNVNLIKVIIKNTEENVNIGSGAFPSTATITYDPNYTE